MPPKTAIDHDLDRLCQIATEFWVAIDLAKQADPPEDIGWLHRFPVDCCHNVSFLLAIHLRSRGFTAHHVWGQVGEDTKHVWLEVAGITVDITAKQFGREPVIVSQFSRWHAQLQILSDEPDGETDDEFIDRLEQERYLQQWYEVILRYLH